jgi:hypothetical protein
MTWQSLRQSSLVESFEIAVLFGRVLTGRCLRPTYPQ